MSIGELQCAITVTVPDQDNDTVGEIQPKHDSSAKPPDSCDFENIPHVSTGQMKIKNTSDGCVVNKRRRKTISSENFRMKLRSQSNDPDSSEKSSGHVVETDKNELEPDKLHHSVSHLPSDLCQSGLAYEIKKNERKHNSKCKFRKKLQDAFLRRHISEASQVEFGQKFIQIQKLLTQIKDFQMNLSIDTQKHVRKNNFLGEKFNFLTDEQFSRLQELEINRTSQLWDLTLWQLNFIDLRAMQIEMMISTLISLSGGGTNKAGISTDESQTKSAAIVKKNQTEIRSDDVVQSVKAPEFDSNQSEIISFSHKTKNNKEDLSKKEKIKAINDYKKNFGFSPPSTYLENEIFQYDIISASDEKMKVKANCLSLEEKQQLSSSKEEAKALSDYKKNFGFSPPPTYLEEIKGDEVQSEDNIIPNAATNAFSMKHNEEFSANASENESSVIEKRRNFEFSEPSRNKRTEMRNLSEMNSQLQSADTIQDQNVGSTLNSSTVSSEETENISHSTENHDMIMDDFQESKSAFTIDECNTKDPMLRNNLKRPAEENNSISSSLPTGIYDFDTISEDQKMENTSSSFVKSKSKRKRNLYKKSPSDWDYGEDSDTSDEGRREAENQDETNNIEMERNSKFSGSPDRNLLFDSFSQNEPVIVSPERLRAQKFSRQPALDEENWDSDECEIPFFEKKTQCGGNGNQYDQSGIAIRDHFESAQGMPLYPNMLINLHDIKPATEIDAHMSNPPILYQLHEIWLPPIDINTPRPNNNSNQSQINYVDPRLLKHQNYSFVDNQTTTLHCSRQYNMNNNNGNLFDPRLRTPPTNNTFFNASPILYKYLQRSSWYQGLKSNMKIEINRSIAELIRILNIYHKLMFSERPVFNLLEIDCGGELIEILKNIGIYIDGNGVIMEMHNYAQYCVPIEETITSATGMKFSRNSWPPDENFGHSPNNAFGNRNFSKNKSFSYKNEGRRNGRGGIGFCGPNKRYS